MKDRTEGHKNMMRRTYARANAMNKHVDLLTVRATGWGFTDDEKAVRHSDEERHARQYYLRRFWVLSILSYLKDDLRFSWVGIEKLTGRRRQTWSNLATSVFAELRELNSELEVFRGIAELDYRPVTDGFIRHVADSIESFGMRINTDALIEAYEHGLTVVYNDKKKPENEPSPWVFNRLASAPGMANLRTWDEYLGEGTVRGIVTIVSNKRTVLKYNAKGHPTLHGLELRTMRPFPIINEQPNEPWSMEPLRAYLQELEEYTEPLVDDPDGGQRPHPQRAPHTSEFYDHFKEQDAFMEQREAEKPEPIDLDQFRSPTQRDKEIDLTLKKPNLTLVPTEGLTFKDSRILGKSSGPWKPNVYDVGRNVLGGKSATAGLGFYEPVQLEFECHPNWFDNGTGEAVFEVRIQYRDGIKSGHAIKMLELRFD